MTLETKIDLLQEQLSNIVELLELNISSLNTKKQVSKFLNKSEKTIDNYVKNKTFIKDKHYFINSNNKIEFLPFAILEFKKKPKFRVDIVESKKDKFILSETTTKILKGIL